eukprot:g7227.t1
MSDEQRVLYPYIVMLVNLPVKEDEETQRWICSKSNQDLTNDFADFAPDLLQTGHIHLRRNFTSVNVVKIVYCKDGVRLRRGKAYAYAKFADYHDLVFFEQVLIDQHRHKDDYERDFESGNLRDCMYGWAATEDDFEHLQSIGMNIKGPRTFTISHIRAQERAKDEESKKQLEEDQLQLMKKSSEITELEKVIENQKRLCEERELEYKSEEVELREMRKRHAKELEGMQQERKRIELEKAAQESQNKRAFEIREVAKRERLTFLNKKREQQRAQKKLRQDIDYFNKQAELELRQRQDLLSALNDCMKEGARIKQECQEMSDRVALLSERRRKTNTANLAQQLNVLLVDKDCCVCFGEFDPIMTQDLQKEEGISNEEFKNMNSCGEFEQAKVWRNLAIPCLHAKCCGVCAQDIIDHAKRVTERSGKPYPVQCPYCRQEVKRFVPLRFTTGKRLTDH